MAWQCKYDCSEPPVPNYDTSWVTKSQTLLDSLGVSATLTDMFNFLWNDIITPALTLVTFTLPSPGAQSCLNELNPNILFKKYGNIRINEIHGFLCHNSVTVGQFQVWPNPGTSSKQLWFVGAMNASVACPIIYELPLYNTTHTTPATFQLSFRGVLDLACSPSNTVVIQNIRVAAPALLKFDYELPPGAKFYSWLAQQIGYNVSELVTSTILSELPDIMNTVNDQLKSTGAFPLDTKVPCDILDTLVPYCNDSQTVCMFQYGGMPYTNPPGVVPCGDDKCIGSCLFLPGACCIACTAALNNTRDQYRCIYDATMTECFNMAQNSRSNPDGNPNGTGLWVNIPDSAPKNGLIDCGHAQCSHTDAYSCSGCQQALTCDDKPTVSSYCVLDPKWVPASLTLDTVGPALPASALGNFIQTMGGSRSDVYIVEPLAKFKPPQGIEPPFLQHQQ